ncbi:hypothetical protein LPJ66_000567 [Kickxella alabastrina]|uniref:Uncharacterized protein n=1 Tax=Kickxella alabastrina TaxID=61397 RepID=A0ACC1IVQ6_9FUNG|nr:hypothetical protein LPJ66_000567 [Kickxella alabastrina]
MSNAFFSLSRAFAVVGASADRTKFGNKVLRWYINNGLSVTPINPKASEIEGIKCEPSLTALLAASSDLGSLENVSVSVITPPTVSESVIEEAAGLGVKRMWFQPGSEPVNLSELAENLGVSVIGNGPCILRVDTTTLPKSKL